jgi:hypothetical protein
LSGEGFDAGVDVVADQAHALDAVDAAFGGFVGVPVLQLDAVGNLHRGVATEGDDEVDRSQQVGVDGSGGLTADIDADLGEDLSREGVDLLAGLVPAECTSTRLPAALRINPAAIWDLPPLRTQTNSTDGVIGPARRW